MHSQLRAFISMTRTAKMRAAVSLNSPPADAQSTWTCVPRAGCLFLCRCCCLRLRLRLRLCRCRCRCRTHCLCPVSVSVSVWTGASALPRSCAERESSCSAVSFSCDNWRRLALLESSSLLPAGLRQTKPRLHRRPVRLATRQRRLEGLAVVAVASPLSPRLSSRHAEDHRGVCELLRVLLDLVLAKGRGRGQTYTDTGGKRERERETGRDRETERQRDTETQRHREETW